METLIYFGDAEGRGSDTVIRDMEKKDGVRRQDAP